MEREIALDLSNLSLEFEVIAHSLRDGGLPDGISPEHFAGARSRWIAKKLSLGPCSIPILVSELNKEGRAGEVQEFEALLNRLYQQPVQEATIPEAVERLRELASGRNLARVLPTAASFLKNQRISEAKRSIEEFLFSPDEAMEGVLSEGDLISRGNSLLETIDRRIISEDFEGAPTYIPPIDEIVYGLMDSEVGLIAGGTGQGKSIGMLDIGMRNWEWAGKDVIGFTIEMGEEQQELRQLAWAHGIDITKFRIGDITPEERKTCAQFFEERMERKNLFYWVDIPENINASKIERKLIQAERTTKRDFEVVLIDYLGIMAPIGRYRARTDWDSQAEIAWNIHQVGRRTKKKIWSAVQKKENISEKEKKKGGLSSIGLSYLIAQPVDIVIVLIEHILGGFLEANIAKGRDVPKKKLKLTPELRCGRLERIDGKATDAAEQLQKYAGRMGLSTNPA